jgi:hypothetical protein
MYGNLDVKLASNSGLEKDNMYGGLGVKLASNSGLEKDMFTGALSLTSSNTTITSLPNLETVGTITSGTWSGTAIAIANGGTGLTEPGTAGHVLTMTESGTASWAASSGISTVAPMSLTSTSTGAYVDLASNTLVLTAADATNPGIVSTESQTFAGEKTFTSNLTAPGFRTVSGTLSQFLKADGSIDSTIYVRKDTSRIAIGPNAQVTSPSDYTVAIGSEAGKTSQGLYAIAIGDNAGKTTQDIAAVAIGAYAGNYQQSAKAVAIGYDAGYSTQGATAVAIGNLAGISSQGTGAVSIGVSSGALSQAQDAVAIGNSAGASSQGAYAVAIGTQAGETNQHANSIILNASGYSTNAGSEGFFVNPIRPQSSTTLALGYDPFTKEITYSNDALHAYNEIKSNSILTGSLTMTSDKRLKTNIIGLNNSLDVIKKLNPVSYKKKDSIASTQYKQEEMGFIAQEIQKVLPMVVKEGADNDKILSVNYISLIPLLTKAIQEQQNQIEEKSKVTDELKKQLDRQQKEIDELRALIEGIKK